MFARAISFSVLALPLLATAIALPGGSPPPSCTANTGSLMCCNTVESATGSKASVLLGLLGIVVDTVEVLVGISCNPIIGSVSCTQQTVCCTDNNFNGIVAIGCTPINLNV